MFRRLSASLSVRLMNVQRQAGDGLGDDAHTGVNRRHLDRCFRRDRFARRGRTEVEGRRRADGIFRLIP